MYAGSASRRAATVASMPEMPSSTGSEPVMGTSACTSRLGTTELAHVKARK